MEGRQQPAAVPSSACAWRQHNFEARNAFGGTTEDCGSCKCCEVWPVLCIWPPLLSWHRLSTCPASGFSLVVSVKVQPSPREAAPLTQNVIFRCQSLRSVLCSQRDSSPHLGETPSLAAPPASPRPLQSEQTPSLQGSAGSLMQVLVNAIVQDTLRLLEVVPCCW